jgi:Sulfotransferase domain
LPEFRLSRAFGVGRDAKAFLNVHGGLTRGAVPDPGQQHEEQVESLTKALQRKDRQIEEQAAKLEDLQKIRQRERKLRWGLKRQRIENFRLKNELEATRGLVEKGRDDPSAARASREAEVGALPDFVIIGAQKCGTTAFYGLLTRHPNVEPAAVRELHYFDRPNRFEKGTDWYRQCFPPPQWKNGRRSITGEKTPYYLFHPPVPKRMAEVIPRVRLIVLLRNPVDRAYSQYHHDTRTMQVSKRTAPRTFEEAIEQQDSSYLSRGIYVDQLLRWFELFSREQMLILKSEDFFERPVETLKVVLTFLDLPDWQPEASELQQRRHAGTYKQKMDPSTRRRLEAYFEPHNQRLYEYLGVDFGW